jgi:molybdopterin molybdotransferase
MISFEKAAVYIGDLALPLKTERVDLMQSLSRVLAEDIESDTNVPPFNKSAMDGYACRKEDLHNTLKVIEEIPAGKVPEKEIGINQCARIMTGATVPQGADFVMQIEHVEEISAGYIRRVKESSGSNICMAGEDVQKGEVVLNKGEVIMPMQIAILATAGVTKPLVYSPYLLGVISTGNELAEPWEFPGKSKIRNSNAWQLMAQAAALGYQPDYLGIVPDQEDALINVLSKAIARYDILLISGGVSVGDYDFVPGVLKSMGAEIVFHGLDAKPGKHLLFAKTTKTLIFGLPGNPVSSFVQFELLIKPLLMKMKGVTVMPETRQAFMDSEYVRKKADVLSFIPGKLSGQQHVEVLEYHGSAHIHAYRKANCIIEIPKDVLQIKKGDQVNVRPI